MSNLSAEAQQLSDIICEQASQGPLGGRYVNVKPITRPDGDGAAGHFSLVLAGSDLRTRKDVAIKFLTPSTQGYRADCFRREAKISELLGGRRHITQMVGELDQLSITLTTSLGTPFPLAISFFALERGKESVDTFLFGRRRPKPLFRRLEVVRDVVMGVNRLHSAGYCHRDLKPDNVLLFSGGIAKLADLGTARRISGEERLEADYSLPVGHLLYAAPEMFAGAGFLPSLYVGADWFGVGAILFEAVTNQNLWVAIGLRSPHEIKRTIAAAGSMTGYLASVGRSASQYPIPSVSDYAASPWLNPITDGTLDAVTRLIRSLCDFDFRRRLVAFPRVLHRLDAAILLARRDHFTGRI